MHGTGVYRYTGNKRMHVCLQLVRKEWRTIEYLFYTLLQLFRVATSFSDFLQIAKVR